jgi:TolB protein
MDLWSQELGEDGRPIGDAKPVTAGVEIARAAFSPDGKRVALSKGRRVANVWRVPILQNRRATWADAVQLTFEQALVGDVDVTPDGQRLVVTSDRTGRPELWLLSTEGGEMQQLTTDPTPDWSGAFSPNGEEVVFYSFRSGNRNIWARSAAGGPARRITTGEAQDYYPRVSPDGREIAFMSTLSGNQDIWVVPSEPGEARQVTTHPAQDWQPVWSPDGSWLVFPSERSGMALWRVKATGEALEPLTEGPAFSPAYSTDGTRVYFVGLLEREGNLWEVLAEGGGERQVTDFVGRRGTLGPLALATDGEYLYFTWEEYLGDLWVMDVAQE